MAAVSFYHLIDQDINKAAARLLEKVIQAGQRAIVLCDNEAHCQTLNEYLWTFTPNAFLPHGTVKEENSEHQPIWITPKLENPNNSEIIVTLQYDQDIDLKSFKKCLDLFDGLNPNAVELARQRWKAYKNAGNELTYWQQNIEGQWVKQL